MFWHKYQKLIIIRVILGWTSYSMWLQLSLELTKVLRPSSTSYNLKVDNGMTGVLWSLNTVEGARCGSYSRWDYEKEEQFIELCISSSPARPWNRSTVVFFCFFLSAQRKKNHPQCFCSHDWQFLFTLLLMTYKLRQGRDRLWSTVGQGRSCRDMAITNAILIISIWCGDRKKHVTWFWNEWQRYANTPTDAAQGFMFCISTNLYHITGQNKDIV